MEPEDAADVSIRLKVLAGELYTVLCAAESLKRIAFRRRRRARRLTCTPKSAACAQGRGEICGHADVFAPNGAELRGGDPRRARCVRASGENAVEDETTEAAVLPAGALTVTAAAQAVLGGRLRQRGKGCGEHAHHAASGH